MIQNYGAIDTAATNLNNAINGGFSVTREGVQQLLTFVQGMQVAAEKVLRRSAVLSQPPQLGSTPAANVYKPYLPTIATDPTQGLIPVLTNAKQQLDQAATSLQGSLAAYEQNEQNVAGSLVNVSRVEMA
jgi:hypothetical protein